MHYRIPLFRRLSEELNGGLTVAHGQAPGAKTPNFDEDIGFRRIQTRNIWLRGETLLYQNLCKALNANLPDVIVAEHSVRNIGLYELLVKTRRRRIPVLLWGHGRGQKRPLNAFSLKNIMHRWLIRNAVGYVAYTGSRAALVEEVFPKKPVFVATNTLDTETLFDIRRDLARQDRRSIVRQLGLSEKQYLLFIGRLHPNKSPGLVLKLAESLRDRGRDIGVLFIGSGAEREDLEAKARGLPDVHFLGAINDWQASAPYIFASSILVMPQWVGLATNHSLALGTPVLCFTTRPGGPIHGPEVDFVVNDLTGFKVPYEDWPGFVARAELLLDQEARFNQQSITFAEKNISIENWLAGMTEAIEFAGRSRVGVG